MFAIASNPKYDGCQYRLPLMIYMFFEKKSAGYNNSASGINNENQQLANELHKSVLTKFKRHKVYSDFKDNMWGADLADMQLISKYNRGFRFISCVIYLYSKYAQTVPLKDKKGATVFNAFKSISNKNINSGIQFYCKENNKKH